MRGGPASRGAAQVEAATGFAPGAVAPFPVPRVTRVLIERTLLANERVWIGAGSDRHMAGLPPPELVRLSKAEPVDARRLRFRMTRERRRPCR